MAYVNVKEWSVEQVTDWMKGLDSSVTRYITHFLNNGVNGHQLLNLRVDDLENFGVHLQGHQELILEAVELLRNFHYELDKENVQMLALRLVCAAKSLYRDIQLRDIDAQTVPTQTMSDVHNLASIVKPLVQWLDRRPFSADHEYNKLSTQILQYCYFMVHHTHRDTFSEKPLASIIELCDKLIKIGNKIVQEVSDPMILQPATLDLATLKKKEQELGFYILASNTAVHQIAEIAFGSPAQTNSKIEVGDEIVQINYQTIVGWQRKSVLRLLQLSSPDIVLTLKKRPRHTKIYGQIYMQPYRLPSKKRGSPYPQWNDGIPSPRLFKFHDIPVIPIPKAPVIAETIDLTSESSSCESDSETAEPMENGGRLYPVKPRMLLQRRNTISGSTPSCARPSESIAQFYQQLKKQATSNNSSACNIRLEKFKEDSIHIRDKSVSCSHVLENRPTTVIGMSGSATRHFPKELKEKLVRNLEPKQKLSNTDTPNNKIDINHVQNDLIVSNTLEDKAISLISLHDNDSLDFMDEGEDCTDRSKMNLSKSPVKEPGLESVHVNSIIKIFETSNKPKVLPRTLLQKTEATNNHLIDSFSALNLTSDAQKVQSKPPEIPQKPDSSRKPLVYPRSITGKNRGHLDKSHSTPAYDLTPEAANNEEAVKYKLGIPIYEEHAVFNVEYPAKNIENEILGNKHIPKTPNLLEVPPKPPPRTIKPPAKLPETNPEITTDKIVIEIPNTNNTNLNVNTDIESTHNLTSNCHNTTAPTNTIETDCGNYSNTNQLSNNPNQLSNSHHLLSNSHNLLSNNHNQLNYHSPDVVPKMTSSQTSDYDLFRFEPRTASSPVRQQQLQQQQQQPQMKMATMVAIEKASSHKSSTSNLVAMIYSNKTKGKKKGSLMAKRRNVSVSDASPGEIQGFLFQRLRNKHTQNVHWEKRWFVLNGSCLYGFKTKDSSKADCYIYLSGFTVTVANEVKSRSNAFKVYHTGTVFYFSAENSEVQTSWIELITSATLSSDSLKLNEQIFYSETDDDSSNESHTKTPDKPDTSRKFNSLKKFTRKRTESTNSSLPSGSTSLDRKWFFHKTGSSKTVPVKTAQFRSYRKIVNSTTTGNFTSHIPNFANRLEIQTLSPQSAQNISSPNLASEEINNLPLMSTFQRNPVVHNSNPSLFSNGNGNGNFSTGSAATNPRLKTRESVSLEGCVTLKELMLRQQEERKLNPHFQAVNFKAINHSLIRADVVYGELPMRHEEERSAVKSHVRTASDCSETIGQSPQSRKDSSKESSCFGKRTGSIRKSSKASTKNNSLPRGTTGTYDDTSGTLYRDRSYEMICCPQATTGTDVQFAQNRKVSQQDVPELRSARHQYTAMTSPLGSAGPLTPEERFHFDLASITAPSPLTPSGSGGKGGGGGGGGKLKQFFGGARQDSKRGKKVQSPKMPQRGGGAATSGAAVYPRGDALVAGYSWGSGGASDSKTYQDQYLDKNFPPALQELALRNSPPTDYPGLEYPPVFEPETYSLADPHSTSLTLLRKQARNS